MRTKYSKTEQQYDYILSCINNDDETLYTPVEKLKYFMSTFNKEYNTAYGKRVYPILSRRIAEYLKGLPSCCNIEFRDYYIGIIATEWDIAKKDRGSFTNRWFEYCGNLITSLCNKYNIDLSKYL